jgi:hypothetical protein
MTVCPSPPIPSSQSGIAIHKNDGAEFLAQGLVGYPDPADDRGSDSHWGTLEL